MINNWYSNVNDTPRPEKLIVVVKSFNFICIIHIEISDLYFWLHYKPLPRRPHNPGNNKQMHQSIMKEHQIHISTSYIFIK